MKQRIESQDEGAFRQGPEKPVLELRKFLISFLQDKYYIFIPNSHFSLLNYTYAYVPQPWWETSFPGVAIGMSPAIHPANRMGCTSSTIPILPAVTSVGSSSPGTPGTFLQVCSVVSPLTLDFQTFPLCALTLFHLLQPASSPKFPPGPGWIPAVWVHCYLRPFWMKNEPSPTHKMKSLFLVATFRFLLFSSLSIGCSFQSCLSSSPQCCHLLAISSFIENFGTWMVIFYSRCSVC